MNLMIKARQCLFLNLKTQVVNHKLPQHQFFLSNLKSDNLAVESRVEILLVFNPLQSNVVHNSLIELICNVSSLFVLNFLISNSKVSKFSYHYFDVVSIDKQWEGLSPSIWSINFKLYSGAGHISKSRVSICHSNKRRGVFSWNFIYIVNMGSSTPVIITLVLIPLEEPSSRNIQNSISPAK